MRALTVDELLAAPRGQQLCLAFAELGCEILSWAPGAAAPGPDAWRAEALYHARYVLDPDAGTMMRVLVTAAGSEPIDPAPRDDQSLAAAVAQAAAAITDLRLPAGTPELLLSALAMTVGNARYWQAPDGTQVLAARPELREPLERVAAHMLASPSSAWWTRELVAAPQWLTSFGMDGEDDWAEGGNAAAAGPRDTGAMLSAWAEHVRQLEDLAQVQRDPDPAAAWSGEWWSTPPRGLLASTCALDDYGSVRLHLQEDSFGPETAVVTSVGWPANARVYEVRSPQDWAALCRMGALSVAHETRHDWFRATGVDRSWVIPDWQIVARSFDAVHLSVAGYLTGSGRAIDCGPEADAASVASVIAGWDPDVTYWLNDVARPVGEAERWERVEPDTHINVEAWRLSSDAASPGRHGE